MINRDEDNLEFSENLHMGTEDLRIIMNKYRDDLNMLGYDFAYCLQKSITNKVFLQIIPLTLSKENTYLELISGNVSNDNKNIDEVSFQSRRYVRKENLYKKEQEIKRDNQKRENFWYTYQYSWEQFFLSLDKLMGKGDDKLDKVLNEIIKSVYFILSEKEKNIKNFKEKFNRVIKELGLNGNIDNADDIGEPLEEKIRILKESIRKNNILLDNYDNNKSIFGIIKKTLYKKDINNLKEKIKSEEIALNKWIELSSIDERIQSYRSGHKGLSVRTTIFSIEERIKEIWVLILTEKYSTELMKFYKKNALKDKNEIEILKEVLVGMKDYEKIFFSDKKIEFNYILESIGLGNLKHIKENLINNSALDQTEVNHILEEVREMCVASLKRYALKERKNKNDFRINRNRLLKKDVIDDINERMFFEILIGEDYLNKCSLFPIDEKENSIHIGTIEANNFKLYGLEDHTQYILLKQLYDLMFEKHIRNDLVRYISFDPFKDGIKIVLKKEGEFLKEYKQELIDEIEYIRTEVDSIIDGNRFSREEIGEILSHNTFITFEEDFSYLKEAGEIIEKEKLNNEKNKSKFSNGITEENIEKIKKERTEKLLEIDLRAFKKMIKEVTNKKDREIYLNKEISKIKKDVTTSEIKSKKKI